MMTIRNKKKVRGVGQFTCMADFENCHHTASEAGSWRVYYSYKIIEVHE